MEVRHQNNFEGQVSLPFDQRQFTSFLVSLLGKPQTITKNLRGSFDIDKDNIISIFETLNQRIYQQNEASLIQFTATIYYSDNSTVTLNGYEHLVNYSENIPLVSRGIHLTWTYLIKFRDKDQPEKQEINVSFVTEHEDGMMLGEQIFNGYQNLVNIRIAHTARTWGADIEALLTKHLSVLVKPPSKIYRYFAYDPDKISNIFSAIIFVITLIFFFINYSKVLAQKPATDISFWITFIIRSSILFVCTYTFSKIVNVVMRDVGIYEQPAFITLNAESEKYKAKAKKSFRMGIFSLICKALGSIILGIIGNIIYNYFFN